jgi:hypothetical protein
MSLGEGCQGGGSRMDAAGGAREWLIAALALAMPDQTREACLDKARNIVDALDVYLEEPDRRSILQDLTPNYPAEFEKLKAERDAVFATAEQAVKALQETLERLQAGKT